MVNVLKKRRKKVLVLVNKEVHKNISGLFLFIYMCVCVEGCVSVGGARGVYLFLLISGLLLHLPCAIVFLSRPGMSFVIVTSLVQNYPCFAWTRMHVVIAI